MDRTKVHYQISTVMPFETQKNYAKTDTPQDAAVAKFKDNIITKPDDDTIGDINHVEKKLEKLTVRPAASSSTFRPHSTHDSRTTRRITPTMVEKLEAPSTSNPQLDLQTPKRGASLSFPPTVTYQYLSDDKDATWQKLDAKLHGVQPHLVLSWPLSFLKSLSVEQWSDWETRFSRR